MSTVPRSASAIAGDSVRERILSGDLQPGDRAPSARELAREFGISPATAAKALSQLAAVGLVGARPGVGMIVLHGGQAQAVPVDRYGLARRTGRINREGEYAKRLSASEEPADPRVRAALQIDTAQAFCRRRIRYDAKHRAIEHSASWFPLDLARQAPRLWDLSPIEEGALTYLAGLTGRTATTIYEEFFAREADDLDAEYGIAEIRQPILGVESVAYDEHHQPITYEVANHPPRERITSGLRLL